MRLHKGELLLLERPRYFLPELFPHRYSEEVTDERDFENFFPTDSGAQSLPRLFSGILANPRKYR